MLGELNIEDLPNLPDEGRRDKSSGDGNSVFSSARSIVSASFRLRLDCLVASNRTTESSALVKGVREEGKAEKRRDFFTAATAPAALTTLLGVAFFVDFLALPPMALRVIGVGVFLLDDPEAVDGLLAGVPLGVTLASDDLRKLPVVVLIFPGVNLLVLNLGEGVFFPAVVPS